MNTIVIKIGTRVLTKGDGQLNEEIITNLVNDVQELISAGKRVVVVSSGAVSCGKITDNLRSNFSVKSGSQDKAILREQILASIGQPRLMSVYICEFSKYSLICGQVLVTRGDFADRKHYLSMRTVIENMLEMGMVPIFNENDVLSPEELDFSDNDQLACIIAAMIGAEKLIILTNVDGVFDHSPDTPSAKLLSEINDLVDVIANMDKAPSVGGKGGMRSKLYSADLITSLGTSMHIANGLTPNILSRIILKNERIGTFFPAVGEKNEPLKIWISVAAASTGKIAVSTYLADVLKRRQPASILLAGIDAVVGGFKKNDVISVCDVDGIELGKGQCRYSSDDLLEEVRQHKESGGERRAGGEKIAIHYNNFVFS